MKSAGEAVGVSLDLLVQTLGRHAVEVREIRVKHYTLSSYQENRLLNLANPYDRSFIFHAPHSSPAIL